MHGRLKFVWNDGRVRYVEGMPSSEGRKRFLLPIYRDYDDGEGPIIIENEYSTRILSPYEVWKIATCHQRPSCINQYCIIRNDCLTTAQKILQNFGIRITLWKDVAPETVLIPAITAWSLIDMVYKGKIPPQPWFMK